MIDAPTSSAAHEDQGAAGAHLGPRVAGDLEA